MSVAKYKILLEKSISAAISAIEIYNKPDFKYREESFVILLVNAYEIMLKAKVVKESKNSINALYFKENKINKKGEKTKQKVLARSRSGNFMTIDIFGCIRKLRSLNFEINEKLYENIESIVEIRDNAIHFCNDDRMLNIKIQTLGTAALINYLKLVGKWFNEDLSKYNFYLMPVSFYNGAKELELLVGASQNKEIQNLVKYLALKESKNPYSKNSDFHFTLNLDINIKKSPTEGQVNFMKTNDPNAPKIQLSEEDIRKNYPLDDTELFKSVSTENSLIKKNSIYYKIRNKHLDNPNLCYKRYSDPRTNKGTLKKFYNSNLTSLILQDFSNL
jgi:hypothetical protein